MMTSSSRHHGATRCDCWMRICCDGVVRSGPGVTMALTCTSLLSGLSISGLTRWRSTPRRCAGTRLTCRKVVRQAPPSPANSRLCARCTEYSASAATSRRTQSNGMSAGNTLMEARTQALSEIFERDIKFRIIRDAAVPDSASAAS